MAEDKDYGPIPFDDEVGGFDDSENDMTPERTPVDAPLDFEPLTLEIRESEPVGYSEFQQLQQNISNEYSDYLDQVVAGDRIEAAAAERRVGELLDQRDVLYQEARELGFMRDAEAHVEAALRGVVQTGDWVTFNNTIDAASENFERTAQGMTGRDDETGATIRYVDKFKGMYEAAFLGAKDQVAALRHEHDPDIPDNYKRKSKEVAEVNGFLNLRRAQDELDVIFEREARARERASREPTSTASMDDETKEYLRRTAEAAERQEAAATQTPEYVDTPEKEYAAFLRYEETGKGRDFEKVALEKKWNMNLLLAAFGPERETEMYARLKLADARAKKDHSFVAEQHFPNEGLLGITDNELKFLTSSGKTRIPESIALYTVMINHPQFAKDNLQVRKRGVGGNFEMDASGNVVYEKMDKSYTELETEEDLEDFRDAVRFFLRRKLGLSSDMAQEYEQAAFNFIKISDLAEQKSVNEEEKGSLVSSSMNELMHPKQQLIGAVRKDKVWPKSLMGEWARKNKPKANQVPLPNEMFKSFMSRSIFRNGTLEEELEKQGMELVQGTRGRSRVEVDWSKLNDRVSRIVGGHGSKIGAAVQVNVLLNTGKLAKDKALTHLSEAVNDLGLDKRTKEALVYLYMDGNAEKRSVLGWMKVTKTWLGGFREFKPAKPQAFINTVLRDFKKANPSFFD